MNTNNFTEVKGDLLKMFEEGRFDAIGHGCNCFNTMGGGIAYHIAKKFPLAYQVDQMTTRADKNKLGDYQAVLVKQGIIFNIYSQFTPGKDLRIDALTNALIKINKNHAGIHIGLPIIGCGIAGGDWNVVKQIIKKALKDCIVTIVHFEN